jgi:hypothetical protein
MITEAKFVLVVITIVKNAPTFSMNVQVVLIIHIDIMTVL